MHRAGKSWSNRQQAQNSDQLSVKTIWKFLLLAVICTAFLCYTLPHMQTGANFTASGSATATFVFNTDEKAPLNLKAVPDAQLEESSSATSSAASSSESTTPSSAVTAPESTAPSSAVTAPESTVSQPKAESGSEIQSTPVQEGTQENSLAAVDAQSKAPETEESTQSGAES